MGRRKGQITIIVILLFLIALVIYTILLPAFNSIINTALLNADQPTSLLLKFIPFLFLIIIIIAHLNYRDPSYEV